MVAKVTIDTDQGKSIMETSIDTDNDHMNLYDDIQDTMYTSTS